MLFGVLIPSLLAISLAGSGLLFGHQVPCGEEGFVLLGVPIVGGLAVCVGWMMLMPKAGFFLRLVIALGLGALVGGALFFGGLLLLLGRGCYA